MTVRASDAERLIESLQERKVRLQRRLWHESIDREVSEINRHIEQIQARIDASKQGAA